MATTPAAASAAVLNGTTFASLPNEVLDKILSELDNLDLGRFSLANKHWYDYVHSKIGFNVFIGRNRPAPFYNDPRKKGSVKVLTKYGIKSCTVGNAKKVKKFPDLKYPQLLQSVTFHGRMTITKLRTFLTPASTQNLHTLIFSQYSLLNMEMKERNVYLDFPNLKTFMISGQPSNLNGAFVWQGPKREKDNMLLNIQHLLYNVEAPRVKELVLQSLQLLSTVQEELIIKSLWDFVVNHNCTLEKLSIGILSQIHMYQVWTYPKRSELNLPKLKAEIDGLKLRSFFMRNERFTAEPSTKGPAYLRLLLGACKSEADTNTNAGCLENLVWISSRYHEPLGQNQLSNLLAKHQNTLTSVEVTIPANNPDISCSLFQNCLSLKILTLIRKYDVKHAQEDESVSDSHDDEEEHELLRLKLVPANESTANPDQQTKLTDLQMLPARITSLRIQGLKLRTAEASEFANFPYLNTLELQNIGKKTSFGLSLESLFYLLEAKRVGTIYFKGALNEESFTSVGRFLQFTYKAADERGTLLELDETGYSLQRIYCPVDQLDPEVGYPMYSFHDDRSNYFKNINQPFPGSSVKFRELAFEPYNNGWTNLDQAEADAHAEEANEIEHALTINQNIDEEDLSAHEGESDEESEQSNDDDDDEAGPAANEHEAAATDNDDEDFVVEAEVDNSNSDDEDEEMEAIAIESDEEQELNDNSEDEEDTDGDVGDGDSNGNEDDDNAEAPEQEQESDDL